MNDFAPDDDESEGHTRPDQQESPQIGDQSGNEKVGVLVFGKTGVGKSTIMGLLERSWQERAESDGGTSPITKELTIDEDTSKRQTLEEVEEFQYNNGGRVVLVGVIGAPDGALEPESALATALRSEYEHSPVVWVLTRLDLMNPIREWKPESYDLEEPSSKKAKSISEWIKYVHDSVGADEDARVHLAIPDGEDAEEYGTDSLIEQVGNAVEEVRAVQPKVLEGEQNAAKDVETEESFEEERASARTVYSGSGGRKKKRRAQQIITTAAVSSAATGFAPSLLVRGSGLFGIQTTMLVALSRLYDVSWQNVRAVIGALVSPTVGVGLSTLLRQLLPVDERIAHGAGGGSTTVMLGETYLRYLESLETAPNEPDSFVDGFRDHLSDES